MIVVYTRQPTDDQDAHDTHTHETTDDDREWSGGSRRRRKKKRRRRNVDEGHQQQKGTGSGAHQITALSLARSCWSDDDGEVVEVASRWSVVKLFGSECAAVGLSEWVEESEQWQEWWGRQSEWAAAAERRRRTIISNSFKYTTRSKPTEEEGRREENVD